MHPLRRRRLTVILLVLVVLGLASCLVMYALRQNINLFYSPSDLYGQEITRDRLIRLGGLVVPDTVTRDANSLLVNFQITDNQHSVDVAYKGVLPDLFREGQSIVTQGYFLGNGKFKAVEVLAKHDENYMPKEVKSALSAAQQKQVEKG